MKSLIVFFVLICTVLSSDNSKFISEIKTNQVITLQGFGGIILDSGIADLTQNQNGASVVLRSGKLWVSGIDEKIEIFCNEAILTVDGIALVESDETSSRVRVMDGYVRIVETGGFPGEMVSVGYDRKLLRNGKHDPRKLYSEDLRSEFCNSHGQNQLFGCNGGDRSDIIRQVSSGETPKITIVIHPFTQISSETYVKFPELLEKHIKKQIPDLQVTLLDKVSYRSQWEYSSQKSGDYVVIDWSAPKTSSNQKESILISFYDSKTGSITKYSIDSPSSGSAEGRMSELVDSATDHLAKFLKASGRL